MRCVWRGCQRLIRSGLELCDDHYDSSESSPCCGAQVMAGEMTDGDLVGYCSKCEQIVHDRGVRMLVQVTP